MKHDNGSGPDRKEATTQDRADSAAARVRRSQQERTDTTKLALLDAAVATLVDEGFGGASASVICRRAGLSHGALFRHFATKDDLLAAAADYCYARQLARFGAEVRAISSASDESEGDGRPRSGPKSPKPQKAGKAGGAQFETDRLEVAIRALWNLLVRPEMTAVNELRLGARTDSGLRKRLPDARRAWEGGIGEAGRELFPELAALPAWSATSALILELLQALAVARLLEHDRWDEQRALKLITDVARSSLRKGKHRGRN
jgi:AcrR family transcriptional regulator